MSSNWFVRDAGVEDTQRLALVGAATFLDAFAGILDGEAIVAHCRREHSPEAYQRYLSKGAHAWLAETETGGCPVGFALLAHPDIPGSNPEGGDLELKRIYALSRFHGRGLGLALMERAVAFATNAAARRLLLGVYAGNARAIAFYTKCGFAPIATRRFRVGTREYDDLVLAKTLARGR